MKFKFYKLILVLIVASIFYHMYDVIIEKLMIDKHEIKSTSIDLDTSIKNSTKRQKLPEMIIIGL